MPLLRYRQGELGQKKRALAGLACRAAVAPSENTLPHVGYHCPRAAGTPASLL
jgi:hypothetical protein